MVDSIVTWRYLRAGKGRDEARDGRGMSGDAYAVSAPVYDLSVASFRPGQVAALERLLPLVRTGSGPVLDIGAGSGLNTVFVLERLPDAQVYALEPSPAMRALTLAKVAAHPEWFNRVTIRPEGFGAAPLPEAIGGAVLLGVLGHFSPDERAALFAALAARLPEGGAAVMDLQPPARPERVEPYEVAIAQIGELTYRGVAEGWPIDGERMRWRMTYRTLDGERVLTEESAEHVFRHPDPEVIRAEVRAAGLSLGQIGETTFYLIVKD